MRKTASWAGSRRPPDTSLRREHTRQKAGSTRIIFETVSPPGESASVLAAVKMLWGGSEGTYPSLH